MESERESYNMVLPLDSRNFDISFLSAPKLSWLGTIQVLPGAQISAIPELFLRIFYEMPENKFSAAEFVNSFVHLFVLTWQCAWVVLISLRYLSVYSTIVRIDLFICVTVIVRLIHF